jgi:hypothetical protein
MRLKRPLVLSGSPDPDNYREELQPDFEKFSVNYHLSDLKHWRG